MKSITNVDESMRTLCDVSMMYLLRFLHISYFIEHAKATKFKHLKKIRYF